MKLLFDLYHTQVMQGNLIERIREFAPTSATTTRAASPAETKSTTRKSSISRRSCAIAATGYQGYVAQEFIPTKTDTLESLRRAVQLCDI